MSNGRWGKTLSHGELQDRRFEKRLNWFELEEAVKVCDDHNYKEYTIKYIEIDMATGGKNHFISKKQKKQR